MRVQDYQRSKVYAAEDKVFNKGLPATMESMESVRSYMDRVMGTEYWGRMKGWTRVTAADGRGRRSACYKPSKKQVCFPSWSRSEWIIIHELAHCLTHRTTKSGTGHGTHFVGHYLNLVEEMLSRDTAVQLAESFTQHGARYHGWQ